MAQRLLNLFFPRKCVLCRELLSSDQTDVCHACRKDAPFVTKRKNKYSFVAGWAAIWYYKDNVRRSLLRFKFYRGRSQAAAYGRLLAMQLLAARPEGFDVLTWVPISPLRMLRRGYDQGKLLADALGRELHMTPVRCLRKIRHNRPQSGLTRASQRRANVIGAYRVCAPASVRDQRILLVDDIITTGATASECARTLLVAGAKEVFCGAVAVAENEKNHTNM